LVVAALFYVMVFRPSRQARREAEAEAARADPESGDPNGPASP
jgi:hypothetical protein